MKVCTNLNCQHGGKLQELSGFDRDPEMKDGRRSRCKSCSRAAVRTWRQANRDKVNESGRRSYRNNTASRKASNRKWRENNPEKVRIQKQRFRIQNPEKTKAKDFRHNLDRYGLTPEQYNEMVANQRGLCACCHNPPHRGRLQVDHDHKTGRVRALLCHHCNAGNGHFSDDPARLRQAAEYLERLADSECLPLAAA